MLFILGSASTAARVPTTAQASTPSREDAASSHMMDCMTRQKRKKNTLWLWFRVCQSRVGEVQNQGKEERVFTGCPPLHSGQIVRKVRRVFDAAKLGAVVCELAQLEGSF